jgi:Holliday junction resolvase
MPNSNYLRGARLERLWCKQMNDKGYKTTRSAGSHGLIDCHAWNKDEHIYVQVKNGRAAYTKKDIEALKQMERPKGAKVYLVVRDGGKEEWEWVSC